MPPDVPALLDAHGTRLMRLAVALLGDVDAAQDVVREALLTVVHDEDPLERAVGEVVRGCRRRREGLAPAPARPGSVLAAVRDLSTPEREAVLLRHYLGLSEAATATALGLTPAAADAVAAVAEKALADLGGRLDAGLSTWSWEL